VLIRLYLDPAGLFGDELIVRLSNPPFGTEHRLQTGATALAAPVVNEALINRQMPLIP